MSKNIIFLIVAIIIIAGGWFLLRGNNEPTEPPPDGGATPAPTAPSGPAGEAPPTGGAEPPPAAVTPPAAESRTVRYTNSGYEPLELRVAVGETVTFVNESDDTVWTASGPHPTHTGYPGFDERETSNPGESYSFTFTEKGTWRYHNHLNPGHTGAIIVE